MNQPKFQAVIRDAIVADAEKYGALRRAVLTESCFMLREPDEYDPTLRQLSAEIERLGQHETSRILVAEINQQLVGFLLVRGATLRRLRHSAVVIMAVLQAHRGQGIARRMLQETPSWAPPVGLSRLELTVDVANHRAIRLYQKLGFRIEGTRRGAISLAGQLSDDHVMAFLS